MNSCVFSGNLTRDPETRQAGQGTTLNFSIAVTTGWGERKSTMFISCSAYGKEKLAQYLHKGAHVTVSGELSQTEYQGKTYLNLRVRDLDLPPKASGGNSYQPRPVPQPTTPDPFCTTEITEDTVPF